MNFLQPHPLLLAMAKYQLPGALLTQSLKAMVGYQLPGIFKAMLSSKSQAEQ